MLEDAKVDRLLVWLNAPGDGVPCRDVDPADEVRLDSISTVRLAGSSCFVHTLLWTSMFSMPAIVAVSVTRPSY